MQVGSSSTRQSVRLARHAVAAGADAIACVTPYYLKTDEAGLADHLRAVHEAAPELPLLAYSIPRLTGYAYGVETLAELADEGVVHGVKESSDEIARLLHLREACGPDFAIFAGSPTLMAAAHAHGMAGTITGLAAVAPGRVRRGAAADAPVSARRSCSACAPRPSRAASGHQPAGVKACAALRFDTPPAMRAPRHVLTEAEHARAASLLQAAGLSLAGALAI